MQWFVGKRSKILIGSALVFTSVGMTGVSGTSTLALVDTGGSTINATICAASSQITLTSPVSDSVVAESAVVLTGTARQANQIEVKVDDAFDNVITLSAGQEAFNGSVQLTPGTHTITVTAIDVCGMSNASVTSVVTYTPPPSTPSIGDSAETDVNQDTPPPSSGVMISSPGEQIAEPDLITAPFIPSLLLEPLNNAFRWLNLAPTEAQNSQLKRLSVTRAVALSLGAYMTSFGIATGLARGASSLQLLQRVKVRKRLVYIRRGYRIIGIVLIALALLWP